MIESKDAVLAAVGSTQVKAAVTSYDHSYVDWGAVLAGAVLATAISFILLTFGAALGLGLSSPHEGEGVSVLAFVVATGLWFVWVQVSSFMAGSYVTGRLRRRVNDSTEHEVDVRDGLHGLLVWATGALAGAFLAASALGGATAAADRGPQSVVERVGEVATAATSAAPDATVGDAVGANLTQTEEERADKVRRYTILAAFVAAASLLVSAAASFFAAGMGGRHRDQGVLVPFFTRRRW